MRKPILLTSLACGLLAATSLTGAARAEEVRTTHTTKVMKRPGEQSPVVLRVSAGHQMEVLAEEGRWIKVRVEGRTGWVARTQVESSAEAREVQRNTRRRPFVDGRSMRRGWSGDAPDDRIGADAVSEDSADDRSAGRDARDSDDDGDDARPMKKKAPAKKIKVRRDDEAASDEADDEVASAKKAKSHKRPARDDGDDADADDRPRAARDGDDDDAPAEPAKPEKKMVTVVADEAQAHATPSKRGRAAFRVNKGDRVAFVETSDDGKWVQVENDDGDSGWIRARDVADDGHKAREISLDARVGFASIGESFQSNGTGSLANYKMGSAAFALGVGGGADWRWGQSLRVGGELGYVGAKATPGVRYKDGTTATDIGFTTHDVDVRAKVGYDLHRASGALVWGHLGYHYGAFTVDNVGDLTKNLAKVPSETLTGPTIGAAFDLPKLTDKLGARATADLLYPGTRTQTKGLEDGAASKTMAAFMTATLSYAWKDEWTFDAGYRLAWASTNWAGAATGSQRGNGATTAQRTDLTHVLSVGIAKSF